MHVVQFFVSHQRNVSTLRNEAANPTVRVFDKALFPRVVGMCKIDGCMDDLFEILPACESDVVVRGDTLNNNLLEGH
jgi:hypothetical protein